MTYNNGNKVKPSNNFFLSWVLVSIIFFSIVILENTSPIILIPILGFHGIMDTKTPAPQSPQGEMHYPQQDLEKLIEYLILHNYWFLTPQDIYDFFLKKSKQIPIEHLNQKSIMISFDDGYKTVYTNLLPILYKLEKKYGMKVKVTLFINPGTLAKRGSSNSTHLGCQELREGFKKGFYDIQSHGLNHKKLTNLSPQKLVDELLQAQTELRKCTKDLDPEQKVAAHLAYPYGAYNQQVEYYASKYYLSSYVYNNKILDYGYLKNYYEIPRLGINRQKLVPKLIKILERVH
jgi:peptidoglycan/xylan/chitin deacetylase (PgdA/CDA1 family)